MPIQNPRDFFVYGLSVMHSAEQSFLNMMPQMEQSCSHSQIKQAFSDHITETQRQVTRIQECFRLLGAQPMNVSCHAVDCMQQDLQSFTQQRPNQDIVDLFCASAGSKGEHYEIAAYRSLVEMARGMGESQCASLLEDNLREEESMAQRLEQIGSRFGSQVIQRSTP